MTKDEAAVLLQAILREVDCHAYLEYWKPRGGVAISPQTVSDLVAPENATRVHFGRDPIDPKKHDLRLDTARLGSTVIDLPAFKDGALLTCWSAVRTHYRDEHDNEVHHPHATQLFEDIRKVILRHTTRRKLVWCDESRRSGVYYSEGVQRLLEEGGTVILANNRITKLCLPEAAP